MTLREAAMWKSMTFTGFIGGILVVFGLGGTTFAKQPNRFINGPLGAIPDTS